MGYLNSSKICKMQNLLNKLYQAHSQKKTLPAPQLVELFIESLLALLFPAHSVKKIVSKEQLEEEIEKNKKQLEVLLLHVEGELEKEVQHVVNAFYELLPATYDLLLKDAEAIEKGDPAARGIEEVMRSYPGFYAISIFRIANVLFQLNVPFLPRIFTELAHSKTGIDIHPGATVGEYFFIDHGTGIVIGETTVIGKNVKIYQGVTLGALSVKKEMAETKRHPTIEDGVVIYAGATILGGRTTIGENSVIGGNTWITESIEPNTLVYHQPELNKKKVEV
jgi:serine O-acetyltransferase